VIKIFVKEEILLFNQKHSTKNQQQHSLDHLAVRVGLKDLVGKTHKEVKDHYQKHIPFGFVVHPVVDDQVGNKTDKKVDRIDDSCFGHHILVVVLYKGKGHVPKPPDKAEDHAGGKETTFLPDTVDAVGMPAEFFQYRGKEQQKPCGKNPRADRKALDQLELGSAVPKEQGHGLGQKYAGGGKEKS
jgi:hypothetical protein